MARDTIVFTEYWLGRSKRSINNISLTLPPTSLSPQETDQRLIEPWDQRGSHGCFILRDTPKAEKYFNVTRRAFSERAASFRRISPLIPLDSSRFFLARLILRACKHPSPAAAREKDGDRDWRYIPLPDKYQVYRSSRYSRPVSTG